MMQLKAIIAYLESVAPLAYQEDYDNSGLIVGEKNQQISGILVTLDCLEETIHEAINSKCNLIVAHHPIVFSGIKQFDNTNYVHRTLQLAIKNDIALYAMHTNLDNIHQWGVNQKIAEKLGLLNTVILRPKTGMLSKLVTYCPKENQDEILEGLFSSGAGHIGNYSECSYTTEGLGTFKPEDGSSPSIGKKGIRSITPEVKIEVLVPHHLQSSILSILGELHPYEEIAYELYPILNSNQSVGSGVIGMLDSPLSSEAFLAHLKKSMELQVIKYTPIDKFIQKVAICGGSGQFLISDAMRFNADAYITSDIKYHSFFDTENHLMLCDVGHYESEKCTIDLIYDILSEKFSTFAILKTRIGTNPVKYFL